MKKHKSPKPVSDDIHDRIPRNNKIPILDCAESELTKNDLKNLKNEFSTDHTILALDDTFSFTCSRCNGCCTYKPGDIVVGVPILSLYDVIRISRSLNMDTTDFIRSYTEMDHDASLGNQLSLRYIGLEEEKRCPFLSETGCSIHENKPFACRLFPIKRVITDDFTVFAIPKKLDGCNVGSGKKHTLRKWLNNADLNPYFDYYRNWNILDDLDREKFIKTPNECQYTFRVSMYDIDGTGRLFNLRGKSKSVEDTLEFSYLVCQKILEENGCLLESEAEDHSIEGESSEE